MPSRDPLFVITGVIGLFLLLYFLSRKLRWLSGSEAESIESHIAQLLKSFGRATSPVDAAVLRELYHRGDFPSMLGWIKKSMRLDLRVGLRIVDAAGKSAPMWIETPRKMPAYGTPEFRKTQVIVNVRREIIEQRPFDWIVAGFAHELSHVVLFSIGHPLQHNEKAVDLTAMILGYREFIANTDRTEIHGGAAAMGLSLLALPFGVVFVPGRTHSSLGYLTKREKKLASACLRRIERSGGD